MTQAYNRPETVSYYKRLNTCFTWPVDILSYQLINKDMLNVLMSQLRTLTFMQQKPVFWGHRKCSNKLHSLKPMISDNHKYPTSPVTERHRYEIKCSNITSYRTPQIWDQVFQHDQLQSTTYMRSSAPTSPVTERHRYEIKCSNITSYRAPQIWDQVFQHHQLQSATDMRSSAPTSPATERHRYESNWGNVPSHICLERKSYLLNNMWLLDTGLYLLFQFNTSSQANCSWKHPNSPQMEKFINIKSLVLQHFV